MQPGNQPHPRRQMSFHRRSRSVKCNGFDPWAEAETVPCSWVSGVVSKLPESHSTAARRARRIATRMSWLPNTTSTTLRDGWYRRPKFAVSASFGAIWARIWDECRTEMTCPIYAIRLRLFSFGRSRSGWSCGPACDWR
jgi:hypothetical protein